MAMGDYSIPVMPSYAGGNNNGLLGGGDGIGALLIGALLFGGGLGGFGGNRGGYGNCGGAAASGVVSDVLLTPQLNSIQGQINTLSNSVNNNALVDQLVDGFGGIDAGITSVNQNISGTTRDLLNSIANLSTAQAAANFTTLSSINGLGRDVTAQANQNALQQLNSFNQVTTSVLQGFNEVSRDNANAFNQVQMSLNAMAAANAACCCDIKASIAADGNDTRALINAINLQNIQGQLADAKCQISDMNQTNILKDNNAAQTNTILHHLIPFINPVAASVAR